LVLLQWKTSLAYPLYQDNYEVKRQSSLFFIGLYLTTLIF
jgi:hypothetical protein